MNKIILCFDIDNTICVTDGKKYNNSKPIKKVINRINELHDEGYYIKIFTARYMGRTNDNIFKAKKMGLLKTKKQLKRWNLKYDELIMGKPSYDLVIDDKAIGFSKNWLNNLNKKLKNI